MTLADFSIRRPVFAWMLMLALIFFGAISYTRLGIGQLPEATQPILTIEAQWTGAAPELMETEIVNPIEQAVVSVQGLQNIEANMRQGTATIKLRFDLDKNIDSALQETNSKLRSVRLPADVQPPTILKVNTDDTPIMWLAVNSAKRPFKDIVSYIDQDLKNRFQVVPGVGNIIFGGWSARNLRVWVDNNKLLQRQLTILDIQNTLRLENEEVASGYLENDKTQFDVRTMGAALSPEEMGNLIIRQRGGVSIYHSDIHLHDVATIEDGLDDARSFARNNGITTVGLGVQKQHGANEVATGQAVRAFVNEVNKELSVSAPDLHVVICYDGTKFTSDAIHQTEFSVLLSAIITGLVCWAFLGSWSSTFNVLISIPISVLGTFIVMDLLGFTLNFFTLLGLGLAIGIVVDDAIMVLENIVRHFHMGKTAPQAAGDGAREITLAATASTVAVITVFMPVLFVHGMVGTFLFQYGLTLSVAVALSLLESITFTPMRCSQFMATRAEESDYARRVTDFFARNAERYREILGICLDHRWKILVSSLVLFIISLASVPLIKKEFSPPMDIGVFLIQFQTPAGSSLNFTDQKVRQLEKLLHEEPSIENYFVDCGGPNGDEVNKGHAFITLKPRGQRPENLQQVVDKIRQEIKDRIPEDFEAFIVDLAGNFGATKRSNNIELSVRGPDYAQLKARVADITQQFAASGLMTDIDTDFRDGLTEVRVEPDRDKAALCGVSIRDIADEIHAAIGGVRQGKYTNGSQRYDVRMRLMPSQWQTKDDIDKLLIRTTYGEMIPLAAVTHITEEKSLLTITREMRERAINIYANTATGVSLDQALLFARQTAHDLLPPGYHMVEVGASQDAINALKAFLFTLLLGLILSYMVLATQFNSFIHPIPVLATLPFTLTGAFLALILTHHSLNLYSFIGIVLLMGIAKKNAILLVEFFNKQRREFGLNKHEAILRGAPIRLRPIIMTSSATIAAAVPAVLGLGAGAEVRVPMAVVVIGGIVVSTFFSLIIVPCLYSVMAGDDLITHAASHELDAADVVAAG